MVGKNQIEGARALWINIVVYSCCTRVLLYVKMLKEIETKETIVGSFCDIFIIVSISIGEGARPPGPPAYAYGTTPGNLPNILLKNQVFERLKARNLFF